MITKLSFSLLIMSLFFMVMSSNMYCQDSTAIWYKIGMDSFERRDYSKAVFYLTKYIEKDRRDIDANYRRGVSLYRLQLYRESLKAFQSFRDSVCIGSRRFTERKCDSLYIAASIYEGNCHFRMGNYMLAQITWAFVHANARKKPVYDPETGASLEVLEAASAKMMNSQTK